MRDFKQLVEENYEYMVRARRHFHQHPELSCHEVETVKYITAELEKFGIPYQVIGETSVVAVIKGRQPGKVAAIRGDIDALPITEKTGVEYASVNQGVMHACGHDFHTTFMLASAKILQSLRDELKGTVKIIFQEGEEVGAGAKKVMESGLLDDVENIAGLHVGIDKRLGLFATGYGVRSSAGGGLTIKITGKTGHSSAPHLAVNAIDTAVAIISAVSEYLTRRVAAGETLVFVPTIVTAGSQANIIPGEAELVYNLRAYDEELGKRVLKEVAELAGDVAAIHKAEISVESKIGIYPVVNDQKSTDLSIQVMKSCFGEDAVAITGPATGGEDFSEYQRTIPGTFAFLGAAKEGEYGLLHTETTLPLEEALKYGVEYFLAYVSAYLESDF